MTAIFFFVQDPSTRVLLFSPEAIARAIERERERDRVIPVAAADADACGAARERERERERESERQGCNDETARAAAGGR